MRSLNEVMESLTADQREQVNEKATRLIRAETLRQIREVAQKTQQEVAAKSGMTQVSISRLERRNDMLLSSLNDFVVGLGGELQIIAKIPGVDDVELDLTGKPATTRKRENRRAA